MADAQRKHSPRSDLDEIPTSRVQPRDKGGLLKMDGEGDGLEQRLVRTGSTAAASDQMLVKQEARMAEMQVSDFQAKGTLLLTRGGVRI